jgi:hypothetical protein
MKQGDTKKLKPKDRHKSAWWTRRDESRKAKQEAYAAARAEQEAAMAPYLVDSITTTDEQIEVAVFSGESV